LPDHSRVRTTLADLLRRITRNSSKVVSVHRR
jgi:hypothetical protein